MKYSFLIILMLGNIIFLSSCSSQNNLTAAEINIDRGILFYSDESNFQEEDSYYEALIELKRNFPGEFKNYKIVGRNQEHDSALGALNDTYPALLVIQDNEVVCKVIGKASKDDILIPVSTTLNEWN